MRRFKFPFAYEPKVDLKNTIVYSSILKNNIFRYLKEKYNCIYLDPALIVDNKQSALAYLNGDRVLSFDNKVNNSIFSFNSAQDNFLMLASHMFDTKNLCTYAPYIKRDATQSNLDSIINWEIDAELSIPIHLNMEYFSKLAIELFSMIASLTYLPELRSIHKVDSRKIKTNNFVIIDSQKIEKLYPTLSLQDGFAHFCSEHEFVVVQNNIKTLKSGGSLEPSIATAQDKTLSCGLYVYDKTNGKPIHLINVCKRPTGGVSKKQLSDTNPLELANDLYDHRIFDKNRPTNIAIVINHTNVLFYLLDKVHLAEVVKSVWPDEFLDFIKTEKIEIF